MVNTIAEAAYGRKGLSGLMVPEGEEPITRVGAMAQQLIALRGPEFSSQHSRWITTHCNSSFRESEALFLPPQALHGVVTYMQAKQNKNK